MVFQYIGCVVCFNALIKQRVWSYLLMVYLGFTGLWYTQRTGYTDVDFSYVEHVKSCQQAMNYLNVPSHKDSLVAMGFPLNICTWHPKSGYFKERYFQNRDFKDSSDMDAHFYVFTFPGNMHDTMLYKGHLKLHKQIKNGYAYVNIYTRK